MGYDDDLYNLASTHKPIPCRICGKMLSAATPIGGVGRPKTGQVSVCGYCGEISIFEVSLLGTFLREATLAEIAKFTRKFPGVVQRVIQQRTEWEGRTGEN